MGFLKEYYNDEYYLVTTCVDACDEDIEVGFRQLFIPNKDNPVNPLKNWWKKAEAKFPNHKVRFVTQGDYNTYYMPDNLMYSDFMCKLLPMEMADDPIMDRRTSNVR